MWQKPDFDFMVKEEMDGQAVPINEKSPKVDDYIYMKVCLSRSVSVEW